jgi:hypothetical protein
MGLKLYRKIYEKPLSPSTYVTADLRKANRDDSDAL